MEREQDKHYLKLTKEAFEDYRAGLILAGPGACELIKAFEHIDASLNDHEPGTAVVMEAERRLENLLRSSSRSADAGSRPRSPNSRNESRNGTRRWPSSPRSRHLPSPGSRPSMRRSSS